MHDSNLDEEVEVLGHFKTAAPIYYLSILAEIDDKEMINLLSILMRRMMVEPRSELKTERTFYF